MFYSTSYKWYTMSLLAVPFVCRGSIDGKQLMSRSRFFPNESGIAPNGVNAVLYDGARLCHTFRANSSPSTTGSVICASTLISPRQNLLSGDRGREVH